MVYDGTLLVYHLYIYAYYISGVTRGVTSTHNNIPYKYPNIYVLGTIMAWWGIMIM